MNRVGHYTSLTDSQLKAILAIHGPVSVAFHADTLFHSYRSGVHSCPYYSQINHAVVLVGYNSQGWIIKNSWGTTWGDNGYGIISYGNDCRMGDWVDVLEFEGAGEDNNNDGDQNNNDDSDHEIVQYKVRMTDSYGDGWHGLSLGIRQNN